MSLSYSIHFSYQIHFKSVHLRHGYSVRIVRVHTNAHFSS